MAKWQFGKPINEMNYGELAEELIHIIDLADNCDVDVEAIRQVLDIIEEKYPLNVEFKSVDESWAEFREQYLDLGKRALKLDQC